jgi:ketosteroid isomerase-like protein
VSANLDLVRSIYADWERGDFSSSEWADREIEFVFADGPSPGRWTGLAGMAKAMREWLSAWEQARAEAVEYREMGEERVLVLNQFRGRGKASGIEFPDAWTSGLFLFHIDDCKITRLVYYIDRDRALTDLGLEA